MAQWRPLALCLILVLYSVSRSECRLLNPNTEGQIPTAPSRILFVATSSGKVMYRFSTEMRDDLTKNKSLYDSKRLSPGVSRSESRLPNSYIDGREASRSFRALSIAAGSGKVYHFSVPVVDQDTKKLYESKRLSPGGPDPKHH
ncbi:hypothetical protein HRI_002827200 [Hibiscus trionum]|uniref:Uncharacterized protein n=1 Tax=Hibiscus trionum TaxID=183268 RepID=A0A9W7M8P2_HIBTR|nr:hypothetical protein HRI_002827200 [Hibiscus trionum]